jgi:soluble lytic murein transglycosylase-like protein
MKRALSMAIILFGLGLVWTAQAWAGIVDRCLKYAPLVVRESRYHMGMNAPAHLFLGQIEQESRCNERATAFDGGMGLGQFMPETAKELHERYKVLQEFPFNPYDPRWNVRALIIYDRECYNSVVCKDWYFAFRAYNGGASLLNREIVRAGSCDLEKVEAQCKRKVIRLKNGSLLDLCVVNIEYPYRIFEKSEKYKRRLEVR